MTDLRFKQLAIKLADENGFEYISGERRLANSGVMIESHVWKVNDEDSRHPYLTVSVMHELEESAARDVFLREFALAMREIVLDLPDAWRRRADKLERARRTGRTDQSDRPTLRPEDVYRECARELERGGQREP